MKTRQLFPALMTLAFVAQASCAEIEADQTSSDESTVEGTAVTTSQVTAAACVADVESPLSCAAFPITELDCNQTGNTGNLWTGGVVPFKINDPAGNAGSFTAADEQFIRDATEAWSVATGRDLVFSECGAAGTPACSGRYLVISSGGNSGIHAPSPTGPQYMTLAPNHTESYRIYHELGHALLIPHEFERADRDRYVRLSDSYFCGGTIPPSRCATRPTTNASEPPVQTGTFGIYDSLSVMNYVQSGHICENDNLEPGVNDPLVPASDGSAVQELYRTRDGWAPFQPIGTDISPSAPLDYQLAPGIQMAGSPAVTSMGAPSVEIFATGVGGGVYRKYKNVLAGQFAGWSSWTALSGIVATSDPAAISRGAGMVDVAVRAGAGNLVHIKSFSGSTQTGWDSLGAPPGGAASAPALASWGAGRLDVFVRGTDGGLYHKYCTSVAACAQRSTGWSAWERRGTGTFWGKPAAVARQAGLIDVFVHGEDNYLWGISYNNLWGSFYQVPNLGALWGNTPASASSPAASSWGVNRVDVFFRGADSRLQQKNWNGTSWTGAIGLGGILTGDPSAFSRLGEQRINIVAPNTDHGVRGVWRKYWPFAMQP